jgi:His-Xaa-Ser system protein HxsD
MTAPSHSAPLAFRDGSVCTVIDLRAYRLTAVKKVGYRLAERFTVVLGESSLTSISVTFVFPPTTTEACAIAAVRVFYQDLLDQELREHLAEESRPIRALILAHAFSRTDLVRRQ